MVQVFDGNRRLNAVSFFDIQLYGDAYYKAPHDRFANTLVRYNAPTYIYSYAYSDPLSNGTGEIVVKNKSIAHPLIPFVIARQTNASDSTGASKMRLSRWTRFEKCSCWKWRQMALVNAVHQHQCHLVISIPQLHNATRILIKDVCCEQLLHRSLLKELWVGHQLIDQ